MTPHALRVALETQLRREAEVRRELADLVDEDAEMPVDRRPMMPMSWWWCSTTRSRRSRKALVPHGGPGPYTL